MENLTSGKIRGLQQIANPDGIETTGASRLESLTEIASRYAVPWYKKLELTTPLVTISEECYREY